MNTMLQNERKRQQDILQRIEQRLNALEERTTALLSNIDFESMTPNQRVQAASRLLKLITYLLELREECALTDEDYREQAFMDLMLSIVNEGGELMLHHNICNFCNICNIPIDPLNLSILHSIPAA